MKRSSPKKHAERVAVVIAYYRLGGEVYIEWKEHYQVQHAFTVFSEKSLCGRASYTQDVYAQGAPSEDDANTLHEGVDACITCVQKFINEVHCVE